MTNRSRIRENGARWDLGSHGTCDLNDRFRGEPRPVSSAFSSVPDPKVL